MKQAVLHDGKLIDVVCFDFMAQFNILLTKDTLISRQNVSFDFDNPCKAPQPSSVRSEFHTGSWWIDAHEYLCTQPNDFLVPLMFFIDKTHMVEKGKYTICNMAGHSHYHARCKRPPGYQVPGTAIYY